MPAPWTGTTNPYELMRSPEALKQLEFVNPQAAQFYKSVLARGGRPPTGAGGYTAWKHGLEGLTSAGYTNPRTGGKMSFFGEGDAWKSPSQDWAERKKAGGAGGGAGAGGPQPPGQMRSFFGFLGREAMREEDRTGRPMPAKTLPRIQQGYEAAAADYRRSMKGPQRESAFASRELGAQRTAAQHRAQQMLGHYREQAGRYASGVQSAYRGGQAQLSALQSGQSGNRDYWSRPKSKPMRWT